MFNTHDYHCPLQAQGSEAPLYADAYDNDKVYVRKAEGTFEATGGCGGLLGLIGHVWQPVEPKYLAAAVAMVLLTKGVHEGNQLIMYNLQTAVLCCCCCI